MKTKIILPVFLIVMVVLFFITACKKNKVKGCTDPDSINYNSKANEDDGSCKYQGSVVFWYNVALADTLYIHGVDTLYYYINNVKVGTNAVTAGWASAPSCGQSGSFTVLEQLGTNKSQLYNINVNDKSGNFQWSSSVTIAANPSCTAFQLQYSSIEKNHPVH